MRWVEAHAGAAQQRERIPIVGRPLRGGTGRAVDQTPVQTRLRTVRRPRRKRAEDSAPGHPRPCGNGRRHRLVRRQPPVVPDGHDPLARDHTDELDDARARGTHLLPGHPGEIDPAMSAQPVAVRRGECVHHPRSGVERPDPHLRRGRSRHRCRRRKRTRRREGGQPDTGRRDGTDRENRQAGTSGSPTVARPGGASDRARHARAERPVGRTARWPPDRAAVGRTAGCGGVRRRHGSSVRDTPNDARPPGKICGRQHFLSHCCGKTALTATTNRYAPGPAATPEAGIDRVVRRRTGTTRRPRGDDGRTG